MKDIFRNDLLNFAVANDMIDMTHIEEQFEMKKRQDYLNKHEFKIWEGKNGKWYTYFPDEEKGRIQRERRTRKEIEDLIIDYWKKQEENPTIKKVFNEWNDRRLQLNEIGANTHMKNKQVFKRFYSEFGNKRIAKVSKREWMEFLEEQVAKYNLTAKAFSELKTITKGFLKRAKNKEIIDLNIEEMLFDLEISKSSFKKVVKDVSKEVYTDEELGKLIPYLKDNWDSRNAGIMLLFFTGLRVGELVALQHSDINIEEMTINVNKSEIRIPKTKSGYRYKAEEKTKTEAGERTVVVHSEYKDILKKINRLNPFGEYVFTDEKGNRLTTNSIRRRLERICDKLGIVRKSPHTLRKTYGSILLDNGVDSQFIISQMGHTNISCTENYYHKDRKTVDRKREIMDGISDFVAVNQS